MGKLEKQIVELSKKRQTFLKKKAEEKAANSEGEILDEAIYRSIKEQAKDAGLKYEGGAKF